MDRDAQPKPHKMAPGHQPRKEILPKCLPSRRSGCRFACSRARAAFRSEIILGLGGNDSGTCAAWAP
eukprot:7551534-Pyramimonas_sp.AAC.1